MPSEKLRYLLKTFERELLEALLFVNSVKKISLSDISAGEFKPLYEVEIVISKADEEKRTAFGNLLRDINKNFRDTQDLSYIKNKSVSYSVTVKDSQGVSNTWLVVQQIGFGDGDIPQEVIDAYKNGDLGLIPTGGVSICLTPHKSSEQGHKAFCFLPLPIYTGLPVHVNGHFALGGETRSSLWNEERRTYKWEWNKLLLSRVIPSAYITGLERIKEMLLTDLGESCLVRNTQQLDNMFPVYKEAKDDNWKLLAKEVLNQIYNGHHELFYLYKPLESRTNAHQLVFVPLKQSEEQFPAVFNTLINHKTKSVIPLAWDDRDLLQVVMKDIGLRLLNSSNKIFHSLKDAGVPVSEISPEFIMEFMKSYNRRDIEHNCNIAIQEGCTDLSNTSLQNPQKVSALLQYCRDSDEFVSRIAGVPLCLTQDGKLQAFKEGSEVFCSKLFSILPGSGHRFLHKCLVWPCQKEKLQEKVFKSFDIPSFANYVAESLQPEMFRNPNKMVTFLPVNKRIPNSSWICDVWKFFEEQLKKCKGKDKADGTSPDDSEVVQTIPQDLMVVAQWNLVPCTLLETINNCQTKGKVLTSLSNFDKVLNLESFTGNLKDALGKLSLPVFDTDLLESPVLLSLIPNHRKPVLVLNCLYLHRYELRYQSLSKTNCDAILEFFVDHIGDVQKLVDWRKKIKSLPLHCTVYGELVSLEIERNVLVLPADIPTEGIKQWGQSSRTLLLKQNSKLKALYDAFEYTESHMCDVYSSHILASIECLSKDCILVHLEYIRESLLRSYDNKYNAHQSKLIAALKELSIFETGRGELKRASELYSPHVPLFLAMCNILNFPMTPYAESSWESFMELIGMVKQASNELIIQFADQIEAEGRQQITDTVLEKSELLLDYIWKIENLVDSSLLPRIRTIKFIVPSKILQTQENIYPQYEAEQLMAFEGAVPDWYTEYVWSSCNILPETANPFLGFDKEKTDAVARQLQVCLEKPPLERVILHTQNICDALKEQCERKVWTKEDEYLKSLMSDIYQYLWKDGAKQNLLNRLRQKPIVYLPSENKFVTCGVLVIHLKEELEIKPYLYSAPLEFGGNFELFEKLDTEKRTTCATYARVLERITQEVRDQELHPNERQSVMKAIRGLFLHLQCTTDDTDVCLQVPILYLPTEDYKLMDSTKMIYSNNKLFYEAIGKDAGLPYFVGFQTLDLLFFDCDIEKLPVKYRPLILTKMVEERIDVSNGEVTQGRFTNQLQEFIQRPEFVEGLLRISHHDRYGTVLPRTGKVNESDVVSDLQKIVLPGTGKVNESDVVSGIQKIKVLQVKDLTVDYVYKEKVVGSSKDVFCHIHKKANDQGSLVWYFYTQVPKGMENTRWLREIENKFIKLIKKSTNIDCFRHGSLMLNFLMEIDHPEMISVILDKKCYREYRLPESLLDRFLPVCGTYVHEKWHHMLDNTTYTFDKDEYVALHLHDEEAMDSDSSREESDLYIYAKIMKRIGCDIEGDLSPELTKYEVFVGEERVLIKSANEIYKILRKKTYSRELVQAVDVANNSSTTTLPLQVIFREVRRKLLAIWTLTDREKKAIFKRYLRQWHPDKNIGNEEEAIDVFQYIRNVWDRLTNGDPVSIGDDVDASDYSQSRPTPNRQFYDDVYRQCSRERECYQESSTSSGGYRRSYYHDNDPVSNPMQQRKWFKQAELDLAAAEHFMKSTEEVQAYNWICYMSHQAVEKSLKSMMYRRDANSVNRGHDIYGIAASLGDDSLMSATGEMQYLLGNYTHLQYPDEHAAGRIPSLSFDRAMAKTALGIARRILDEVDAKN